MEKEQKRKLTTEEKVLLGFMGVFAVLGGITGAYYGYQAGHTKGFMDGMKGTNGAWQDTLLYMNVTDKETGEPVDISSWSLCRF